jgi:CubicO group peptidase (beta-lactamase class C family)
MKSVCLFLFLPLLAFGQLKSPKSTAASSKKQQTLDSLFIERSSLQTPGAAIAVVKDGQIVYKKGYGAANLEYNIPNNPSTVFHIASLSKQFTAFSILLLAKDGRLSLDDDIRRHLPEMSGFSKAITIKDLLYHTSGLREWIYLLGLSGHNLSDMVTQKEIINTLSHQNDLNFEPGSAFSYVNSGYNVLGEIVARVSGQSFAEFARLNIFIPLKMNQTQVMDDYEKIVKNKAYSYGPVGGNGYKKKLLNFVDVIGSTGVLSTVEDLSKWAMNFENPVVGDRQLINKINTRGLLSNGDTINYAMGQFIGMYQGVPTIEHSGSDAGFRAHLLRFPGQRLSIIVLANDASIDANDIAYKAADIYLQGFKTDQPKTAASQKDVATTVKQVSRDVLGRYEGKYEIQPGMVMSFSIEGDNLAVDVTGQGKFVLQPLSDNSFKIPGVDGVITFPANAGEVNRLDFRINERQMQGERIKKIVLDNAKAIEYRGEYRSSELGVTYHVGFSSGKMVANSGRSAQTELTPVEVDTFSGDQWFMGIVAFVRDDHNKVIGLKVSTDRTKNVWFLKLDGQ